MSKRHTKQKHQLQSRGGGGARARSTTPWATRRRQRQEVKQALHVRATLAQATRGVNVIYELRSLFSLTGY